MSLPNLYIQHAGSPESVKAEFAPAVYRARIFQIVRSHANGYPDRPCLLPVVTNSIVTLRSLERWSPRLFILAGGLLTVYAVINGMNAFMAMSLELPGLGFAFFLGFLGLLGLYPSVVEHSPWLARIGAIAAALGVVTFFVLAANSIAELLGIVSGNPPAWPLFVGLATTGFVLGYLSFGVAVLQSEVYSALVGIVLMVPAIIIIAMFLHMAAGYASPETVFVVSAGQAMGHSAIGGSLQTQSDSSSDEESASDEENAVLADD